jgi:hypothetical protein
MSHKCLSKYNDIPFYSIYERFFKLLLLIYRHKKNLNGY